MTVYFINTTEQLSFHLFRKYFDIYPTVTSVLPQFLGLQTLVNQLRRELFGTLKVSAASRLDISLDMNFCKTYLMSSCLYVAFQYFYPRILVSWRGTVNINLISPVHCTGLPALRLSGCTELVNVLKLLHPYRKSVWNASRNSTPVPQCTSQSETTQFTVLTYLENREVLKFRQVSFKHSWET
jgi:hypothetical protein